MVDWRLFWTIFWAVFWAVLAVVLLLYMLAVLYIRIELYQVDQSLRALLRAAGAR